MFENIIHCGASTQSWHFVFFSFGSFGYLLGCTVAAVSAQQPVEHVKNALQNITMEGTPHSVDGFHDLRLISPCFLNGVFRRQTRFGKTYFVHAFRDGRLTLTHFRSAEVGTPLRPSWRAWPLDRCRTQTWSTSPRERCAPTKTDSVEEGQSY